MLSDWRGIWPLRPQWTDGMPPSFRLTCDVAYYRSPPSRERYLRPVAVNTDTGAELVWLSGASVARQRHATTWTDFSVAHVHLFFFFFCFCSITSLERFWREANSVASELIEAAVGVKKKKKIDVERSTAFCQWTPSLAAFHAALKDERYLFLRRPVRVPMVSFPGTASFVFVDYGLVFINPSRLVSSLSPPRIVPPRLTALRLRDDRAPPLATNQAPTFWKLRERAFLIGWRQWPSTCR